MKFDRKILTYKDFVNESVDLNLPAADNSITLDHAIEICTNEDFKKFLMSQFAKEFTTAPYVLQSSERQIRNGTFCFGMIGSKIRFKIYESGRIGKLDGKVEKDFFRAGEILRYFFPRITSDGNKKVVSEYTSSRYMYAARILRRRVDLEESANNPGDYPKINPMKLSPVEFVFVNSMGDDIDSVKTRYYYYSSSGQIVLNPKPLKGKNIDGAIIEDPIILKAAEFDSCSMKGLRWSGRMDFYSLGDVYDTDKFVFNLCDMEKSKFNIKCNFAVMEAYRCNLTSSEIRIHASTNLYTEASYTFNGCNLSNSLLDTIGKTHIIDCKVDNLSLNVDAIRNNCQNSYTKWKNRLNNAPYEVYGSNLPFKIQNTNVSGSSDLIDLIAEILRLESTMFSNVNKRKTLFVSGCDFSGLTEEQINSIFDACEKNSDVLELLIKYNSWDMQRIPKRTQAKIFATKAFGF